MNIKRHIPNMITCLNLLAGSMAVLYILHEEDSTVAVWCIILAAIFDFFDGMIARLLGVSSPIGKDLDSLADVVSFGLAPAMLLLHSLWEQGVTFWGATPALLIVAFAALRLAKFNNDTRQSHSFIGLPVPSNAFFWVGLTSALPSVVVLLGKDLTVAVVYLLIALFSYLMVSEIPMFSFKMGSRENKQGSVKRTSKLSLLLSPQGVLILISILSLVFFQISGLALCIVAYILLSVLNKTR